ncbi:MAG: AMP-binding protein, partial [Acidobacteriota bacterium]|nr:AMP-binding protein [Acidobacteriota bacterium]
METRKEVVEGYRLSPQQEHVWSSSGGAGGGAFCARAAIRIEGELDEGRLASALRAVIDRHEILRTSFQRLPGMDAPLQVIHEPRAPHVARRDLSGLDAPAQAAALARLFEEAGRQSFDFGDAPLVRLWLSRLAPRSHVLTVSLPSLCADAITLVNLARELGRAYAAGPRHALRGEPMQYADLSEWQHELLEAEETEAGRDYWRRKGAAALSLKLPLERQPEGDYSFAPRSLALDLGPELSAAVESAATRHSTEAHVLLAACWLALLWRLTGHGEMVIGFGCDGRKYEGLDEALGPFAKNVPLACDLEAHMPFTRLLARVADEAREAYTWQEYYTDDLGARDATGAAAPFIFEHAELGASHAGGGVAFTVERVDVCLERFKLKLRCVRRGGELTAEFYYDPEVFDAETVGRTAGYFRTLLAGAVEETSRRVDELPLLAPAERARLLFEWNDTRRGYEAECIHRPFEAQARRVPQATALVFEGERLTYAELDARADRLARRLRALGVGPESLVGVLLERSPNLVVSLLAVLKAGGAYVPLDSSYPQERLRFMLEDSGARVLLTERGLRESAGWAAEVAERVIEVDVETGDDASGGEAGAAEVGVDNLAYVIYTSGSTGRPKGVQVSHRAIFNRLRWMLDAFDFTPADVFMQKTPFSFDASIWELFVPLWSGATLVLARPGGHQDAAYMVSLAEAEGVTVLQLVPSMLGLVAAEPGFERLARLRWLFSGGEALAVSTAARAGERLPQTEVVNLYGPTEVSIDATSRRCGPGARGCSGPGGVVPIGRPIY